MQNENLSDNDDLPGGWEIVPDPLGQGRGWTAVRLMEDERGPYEEWCGAFYPTREYCWQAIVVGVGAFDTEADPEGPR